MAFLRPDNPEQAKTLVSWKEIASFLNRAERTVRRWERERGLPVHRVPGGDRGGVFAYPSELNAWLLGHQDGETRSRADFEENRQEQQEALLTFPGTPAAAETEPIASPGPKYDKSIQELRGATRWLAWASITVAVILMLAGAATWKSWHGRGTSKGQAAAASTTPTPSHHAPALRTEQLYLQGRYQWSLRTAEGLAKSVDAYTQAIVQDPAYAQAYAGLAETYDLLSQYGRLDRAEAFARAKAAADKAIELDPNLAAGHRAKAFALFYGDWKVAESDAEFKRALALAPNEVETHHWYSTTLFSRQENAKSIAQMDEAVRLAPTNPAIIADSTFIRISLHINREANIKTLRELSQTQPTLVKSSRYLAVIDFDEENYVAYVADLQKAASISHDPDETALATVAGRGWARGGKAELLDAVREVREKSFAQGRESGYMLGRVYLRLGQPKKALDYFNAALERNDYALMLLHACDCTVGLRDDPRYASLFRQVRERMNLPTPRAVNMAVAVEPEMPPSGDRR